MPYTMQHGLVCPAVQVEAGLTDLQQAYEELHRDLAGARGADERRTLEQHVRETASECAGCCRNGGAVRTWSCGGGTAAMAV